MKDLPFVEKDCTIEFQGKKFEAGGAFVSETHIIAYPGKNGVLNDWHGNAIGTWKSVRSWKVRSYVGTTMHQIEATVKNTVYTGRGFGEGMIYKGKRKR